MRCSVVSVLLLTLLASLFGESGPWEFEFVLSLTSLLTGVVYAVPIAVPNDIDQGHVTALLPLVGPIIERDEGRETTTTPPRPGPTPLPVPVA